MIFQYFSHFLLMQNQEKFMQNAIRRAFSAIFVPNAAPVLEFVISIEGAWRLSCFAGKALFTPHPVPPFAASTLLTSVATSLRITLSPNVFG